MLELVSDKDASGRTKLADALKHQGILFPSH